MSKIKIYLLILAVAIVARRPWLYDAYQAYPIPLRRKPDLYEKPGPAGYCRCLRLFILRSKKLLAYHYRLRHRHRRCYAVCYRGPRHDNLFIYQQGFGFPGRCVFDEPGKTNF